jgi:hypothetical protein
MLRLIILFLTALLLLNVAVTAQQSTQMSTSSPTHHVATKQIDGSVNPELIPDLTAYRLVFLFVGAAPNSTPKEIALQQLRLRKIGLGERDNQLLIPILNRFRFEYAALIEHYNKTAEATAAKGQVADSKAFLLLRDNLVQTTRDKLKALSPNGVIRLHEHVQQEKRGMKLSGPE